MASLLHSSPRLVKTRSTGKILVFFLYQSVSHIFSLTFYLLLLMTGMDWVVERSVWMKSCFWKKHILDNLRVRISTGWKTLCKIFRQRQTGIDQKSHTSHCQCAPLKTWRFDVHVMPSFKQYLIFLKFFFFLFFVCKEGSGQGQLKFIEKKKPIDWEKSPLTEKKSLEGRRLRVLPPDHLNQLLPQYFLLSVT